ncbi:hypothetical protein FRC04_009112 [Tulasnella sp. 424]|nr:hypothetical protein FRC04_009112 [Tulasnella sp. 424]KAG8974681.1 hypothetical protein FRC05_007015 [Tulasnella sp. 425]
MSSYQVIQSRPIAPQVQQSCPQCSTQLEFSLPTDPSPPPQTVLQVQCYHCSSILTHTIGVGYSSTSRSAPQPPKRTGRKIGTQERPLETGYYDVLEVKVDATTEEIKKAYRRMALLHHPDKHPGDPLAEERFKNIAVAYQVLSDPERRKKYNEFGAKESGSDAGYVDPEEVFSAIFGGDRFVPIIGEISLGKEMKEALQQAEEAEEEEASATTIEGSTPVHRDAKGKPVLSPEQRSKKLEKEKKIAAEKARLREERVQKLVENLDRKLSIYVESVTGAPTDAEVAKSWREICRLEAEELKTESYGVELLHAIGFVYTAKSRHYLASYSTPWGVGGWLHNVQGKYHVISETVSTVRSALELKRVFDELAAAEKTGISPEEKRRLEEQAAEKGLQALFKGAKLEVDSVLRETCDRILADEKAQKEKLIARATALGMLGDAYLAVRKDSETESEYVKIDTKASRERDARRASTS